MKHKRKCEEKLRFTLKGNVDRELIAASELLEMLLRHNEPRVYLNKIYRLPFLHLVNCTRRKCNLGFKYIHEIVEICNYFMIKSDYFNQFIPHVSSRQAYQHRSVIHKLLTNGFPQIARRMCIEGGLPLKWCKDEKITYQNFKQKFRDYERFVIWYYTYKLAGCQCVQCSIKRMKDIEDVYRFRKNRLKILVLYNFIQERYGYYEL